VEPAANSVPSMQDSRSVTGSVIGEIVQSQGPLDLCRNRGMTSDIHPLADRHT
jgi:hypothetical protein